MFNVIRIPTKFSRPIKRLSDKEKLKLLDALINIWDWIIVQQTDDNVWDLLSLIYWEWMNMESKNGHKKEKEYITTVPSNPPSMSDCRVEESRVEYNRIEKNTIVWEQALEVIEEFWDKEINNIIEVIKWQVEFLWLIYKKGTRERERAKNILTWKDFWQVCEKANMSRIEFCKSIIFMSSKLDFWNWKIYNSETLYKHYAQVYNEAVNLKAKKQKDTSLITF
jgi:hypothetical protein